MGMIWGDLPRWALSGYGDGSGSGSGDGSGSGYGDGDGYGSGDGDGDGYGYGYGYGSGSGDGYGYGSGSGSGDGDGYGSGYDSGYGYGYGYGYGSGSGSGDGYGYGSGSGSGDGYGDKTSTITKTVQPFMDHPGYLALWKSDKNGQSCNGGRKDFTASAGLVQEIAGPLQLCGSRALHATLKPEVWKGERMWLVALHGEVIVDEDKVGALKREFLAEIIPVV